MKPRDIVLEARLLHDDKVEVAVLLATRWIVAKLRSRTFFTLVELNAAIAECVTALNDRRSRHLGASRAELFEAHERGVLNGLPATPFEFAEWKQCRVGLDYHVVSKTRLRHVEIDRHYYSVPHTLLKEKLWAKTEECYANSADYTKPTNF